MTSRVTIRRKGSGTTTNGAGFKRPAWDVVAADVPCRVAGTRAASGVRHETVGDVQIESALRVLHLPATTSGLRDGDYAEVTSGDTAGLVLRLVDTQFQDQATARRVQVIEVQRPEEWD